jgi:mono/diheme cytochrome c family protein
MLRVAIVVGVSVVTVAAIGVAGSKPTAPLQKDFDAAVQPFLKTYCASCHGGEKPKGDLNLTGYKDIETVAKDWRRWEAVLEQIDTGRMPPAKAKEQPSAEMRGAIAAWIRAVRKHEAQRTAGDPGPVPARRLSNAEYDNTIRDLIRADIRPAKEFPVDPANEAGFDNSAESLAMSPALVNKYLEAARRVSEHLLFLPDRLDFAEYGVVADTDRDKFGVRQIIRFYQRQRTDYADYFHAAWRHKHAPETSLGDIAKGAGISPKYLATVWELLTGPRAREAVGPIGALSRMWNEIPGGDAENARVRSEAMRDLVVKLRQKLVPDVKNLTSRPIHNGAQPLVMWKNRTMAANRMRYAGGALTMDLKALAPTPEIAMFLEAPADPDDVKVYETAFATFCSTFPDAFVVSERARVYLNPEGEKKLGGRLLSAGFHSMTGYFRDDGPLYELILSADEQKELDRLWLEFDVITGAPMRTHTSFIWFERTDSAFIRGEEFNVVRAEDKDCTSEAKLKQFGDLYLGKAKRVGASETVQKAITDHFAFTSASIRRVERARLAAEPKHLADVQAFAEHAFRRPLTQADRDKIAAFYRASRDQEGLGHEDAIRDTLVSILVSPHFLFRLETVPATAAPHKTEPLGDYDLASRLSYFLWSSMPDAELLARAKAGALHEPKMLAAQAKRMMTDDRIRALATEFAGNWLDFRRFEEHNAVDRERFPTFTDDLRKAMFEEPLRFFVDVVRTDRSVLDFLYGKHTFVNPVLAKHYGMPAPAGGDWQRIDNADEFGRGGLLPMSVFLTKNAPGLRTSPVKRGYWVVRRVLGEKIPAPPADVPELPADEAKLGDKSLRDVLAHHRADKACAGCHVRFDSVGLAFEGYGPIGERRTKDLGDRPVDSRASFPGGGEGHGLPGLHAYLKENRQDEFVDSFCRKLLAFALGRTLLPGDEELIEAMRRHLATNDYRFGAMVEMIVTSPQFLNRRADHVARNASR